MLRTLLLALAPLTAVLVLAPAASAGCNAGDIGGHATYAPGQDVRIAGDYAGGLAGAGDAVGGAAVQLAGRNAQLAVAFAGEAPGNPPGAAMNAVNREISAVGVEFLPTAAGAATPVPGATVKAASDGVSVWGQAIAWLGQDALDCL
jgi:hypothetical protein